MIYKTWFSLYDGEFEERGGYIAKDTEEGKDDSCGEWRITVYYTCSEGFTFTFGTEHECWFDDKEYCYDNAVKK